MGRRLQCQGDERIHGNCDASSPSGDHALVGAKPSYILRRSPEHKTQLEFKIKLPEAYAKPTN